MILKRLILVLLAMFLVMGCAGAVSAEGEPTITSFVATQESGTLSVSFNYNPENLPVGLVFNENFTGNLNQFLNYISVFASLKWGIGIAICIVLVILLNIFHLLSIQWGLLIVFLIFIVLILIK